MLISVVLWGAGAFFLFLVTPTAFLMDRDSIEAMLGAGAVHDAGGGFATETAEDNSAPEAEGEGESSTRVVCGVVALGLGGGFILAGCRVHARYETYPVVRRRRGMPSRLVERATIE